MTDYKERGGLQVSTELARLIDRMSPRAWGSMSPASGRASKRCWTSWFPSTRHLLARRDQLQLAIDEWHGARRGQPFDVAAHEAHLASLGYLVAEGPDFHIGTQNVDVEISRLAGPQLVVPLSNARYSLNAANARWGSLYDAFYGTDAIAETGDLARGKSYNPLRGREVIARARAVLDQALPLATGSHRDAVGYAVSGGALRVSLSDGTASRSRSPRSSRVTRVRRARPARCFSTTACTSRCASIARTRSGVTTRRVLPMCCWNRR
jgi:malate synthase